MNKIKKIGMSFSATMIISLVSMNSAYAAPISNATSVSTVIGKVWKDVKSQIMDISNEVVFPCITIILAIAFFVKLGMAWFDYKKQGMFDWVAPATLFACLVFSLVAPSYIWQMI